jgi:hypothetical protein
MDIRGVCYDVGRVYRGVGRVYRGGFKTRPVFDPATISRELEIIASDLHCNTVRLQGRDIRRLMTVAQDALWQGLDVWLSPELFEKSLSATLSYLIEAARAAEPLRERFPGRLVFCVGTEASLFTRGIAGGRTIEKRMASLRAQVRSGTGGQPLRAFLAGATSAVRQVFHGPLTYASLPVESVDWSLFDIIGVDHYRIARNEDRYVATLKPFFAHGKPVVNAEFGHSPYQGDAADFLGFGVADNRSLFLHQLPLVGRCVRPRLKKGHHIRDEAWQAREITKTLTLLDAAGVDGAFVWTFADPRWTYSEDPRYDLDMSAASLVKTYAGRPGTTYPDMTWEPKEAFRAVADFYAERRTEADDPARSQP